MGVESGFFSEFTHTVESNGNPVNYSHLDAPNSKFAPTGYRRASNLISQHYSLEGGTLHLALMDIWYGCMPLQLHENTTATRAFHCCSSTRGRQLPVPTLRTHPPAPVSHHPTPGPVSPAVPGPLTGVADSARVSRVTAVAVELLRRLCTHAAVLAGVRVTSVLHVTCVDQDVLRLHQVLWQQNGVSNGGGGVGRTVWDVRRPGRGCRM